MIELAKKASKVKIEVLDVTDGNASVCAYVGEDLYEDPAHADIEKRLAQETAERYIADGVSVDDVRFGWDQIS